jgi:hypothetical protein
LNTPLGRFEYMVINLSSLPQETIDKYNLIKLAQDGKVYIEIQKGMHGLPQAGILANELLQRNIAKDGYRPTQHTHGLWKHDTHPISFSLVVDDFGVKYVGREHAGHLMKCIKNNYNISSDWKGSAYCGLTLEWDYKNRTVDLSIPGYIKAALHKYQHASVLISGEWCSQIIVFDIHHHHFCIFCGKRTVNQDFESCDIGG